jgi:hypothetical protein
VSLPIASETTSRLSATILPSEEFPAYRRSVDAIYLQLLPAHFFAIVNEAEADVSGLFPVFPALRTQTRIEYVPAAPGFQDHVELVVQVVAAVHELPLLTHHSY